MISQTLQMFYLTRKVWMGGNVCDWAQWAPSGSHLKTNKSK